VNILEELLVQQELKQLEQLVFGLKELL